ncbi:MAG: hypothetical protein ACFFGZ_15685 [Candidatus Thorarchaeota archaeon]
MREKTLVAAYRRFIRVSLLERIIPRQDVGTDVFEQLTRDFGLRMEKLIRIRAIESHMTKKSNLERIELNDPLGTDLRTLFQLSDLSAPVQRILEGWLNIRRFIAKQGGSQSISKFQSVTEEEFTYLERLSNQFRTEFARNAEFQEAAAPQAMKGESYDRMFFRSVRLYGRLKGRSFLFPWTFFVEVRHNDDSPFLQAVIHNLARYSSHRQLLDFVDFCVACREQMMVNRTPLSVKYLQALTDPSFSTTLHHFPNQADFMRVLSCSEKAIRKIEKVFWYLGVSSPRYLVNMGQLGFQAFRVRHEEPLAPQLDPFTLRTYVLDRREWLSVVYLPITSDLLDLLPQPNLLELDRYQIIQNFEKLHHKADESWKTPLRLLEEDSEMIAPSIGELTFGLSPESVPKPRPQIDFALLDQIQLVASGYYASLADTLGISEAYLIERMKQLLEQKIISPFYVIRRIGLTDGLLVAFEGPPGETGRFMSNLLAFPYVELFSGPQGGNAIVKLPPTWTGIFLNDVMACRKRGLDVWAMVSSPTISRWGIPLAPLAHQDEFFGILWDSHEKECNV